MLIVLALADSYGMKYEFVPHALTANYSDLVHAVNPKFPEYLKGHYSDDTQMSLANIELILSREGYNFSEEDFVNAWLDVFRRDPHLGYSRHMYKLLRECVDAADFLSQRDPTRGTTSGAAMRAGVLGVIPDISVVKQLVTLQARITHDTAAGITSALAVALSVHHLHYGGSRGTLAAFLTTELGEGWVQNGYVNDMSNGMYIVQKALEAVLGANTLSGVLLNVVNQEETSDTDTVCGIAGIIASKCRDLKDDLPEGLIQGLENGPYGADYLRKVDILIEKRFGRTSDELASNKRP